jgi:hypothetical protein
MTEYSIQLKYYNIITFRFVAAAAGCAAVSTAPLLLVISIVQQLPFLYRIDST